MTEPSRSETILVVGNHNYSSWSLRPWLFLRHHGVPFETRRIPIGTDEWRREIGDWSPTGLVPALHHGEVTVWDSLAILEYANETWADGAGWPRDPHDRAVARSMAAEMHAGFPAVRKEMPMDVRRRPHPTRLSAAVDREVARIVALWRRGRDAAAGDGPWAFGRFSIVDCMWAPVAFRFDRYAIRLPGDARGYVDTLLDHPAMREWEGSARAEREEIAANERP